jgi:rhodanese-related sulfurtransferase
MKKLSLLLLGICAVCFITEGQKIGAFKELNVREFKSLKDNRPNAVILDVRTTDELKQEGMIPDAIQIDYFAKTFEHQIQALDKEKTYLLYCASGARSGETLELMKKAGFKEAYNLKTGFDGWKKAKMPVVPFSKKP